MLRRYFVIILPLLLAVCASRGQDGEDFTILNPYSGRKPFPYKASLHNHTQFHPEYMHSRVPADQRLKDYRDYDTWPPYGITAITDHNRVSTPDNTIIPGIPAENPHPWGVDDFLWIRGNETGIHNGPNGGLSGHLVVVNASDNQWSEPNWQSSDPPGPGTRPVMVSEEVPASVEFSFFGTAIEFISCKDDGGGIAKVWMNGEERREINFFSEQYLCDRVLYQETLSGDELHEIRIVYDRKGESKNRYEGHLIMGYFVIQDGRGGTDTIDARNAAVYLSPLKYVHADFPFRQEGSLQNLFKVLIHDGCFLVLAHPNSRLETEGPHKGKQLWSSSGYVYSELDMIFGNKEKRVPPMKYVPHALEIGNRGYDFSERTGYINAEEKWDYLLAQGHRVWGTASDDSHGNTPKEGWIVVYTRAEKRSQLELGDVMQSLFQGNFYASQGPVMEIGLKGTVLTISTDHPSLIEFISEKGVIKSVENSLTARYPFTGDEIYVRARVTRTDEQWRNVEGGIGRTRSAWSNPFFVAAHDH